jgi:hypothetical protein
MTGFIRGLFGGKSKTETTEETTSKPKKESKEFFLAPDEAKTFGNIDYMRKEVIIRHTFPNVKGGVKEEAEVFIEVSATELKKLGEENAPETTSVIEEIKAETSGVVSQRRRGDSGMDMFRNMAKDLKK